MKPVDFDYEAPTTLEEALQLAAASRDVQYLAGGQSLVPQMNMRLARPTHLIDLNRICTLARVARVDDGLHIGAMTRHRTLELSPEIHAAVPVLATMARHIGYIAVRNRGTIGGSLAYGDPAAEWPLATVALDAQIVLAAPNGARRTVDAREFMIGPFATALASGELIEEVVVPVTREGERWCFREISRRPNDPALAAALVGVVGGVVRVVVGGVEGRPRRLTAVEQWLNEGSRWSRIEPPEVATQVRDALHPTLATLHGSAPYRSDLAANLVAELIVELGDPYAHSDD